MLDRRQETCYCGFSFIHRAMSAVSPVEEAGREDEGNTRRDSNRCPGKRGKASTSPLAEKLQFSQVGLIWEGSSCKGLERVWRSEGVMTGWHFALDWAVAMKAGAVVNFNCQGDYIEIPKWLGKCTPGAVCNALSKGVQTLRGLSYGVDSFQWGSISSLWPRPNKDVTKEWKNL